MQFVTLNYLQENNKFKIGVRAGWETRSYLNQENQADYSGPFDFGQFLRIDGPVEIKRIKNRGSVHFAVYKI